MKKNLITLLTCLTTVAVMAQEFTFGVIPDTQNLTETDGEAAKMNKMMQFFVNQRDALNVQFVASLGDMTQWGATAQWNRVRTAYNILKDANIPYAPCQGNHDPDLAVMSNYFPVSEFSSKPWYGGHFKGIYNAYYLLTISGMDFIIVVIQSHDQFIGNGYYDLPSIDWANSILDQFPERRAILVTHDFYERNWLVKDLINKHDNLFLAVCGHSCGREMHQTTTSPGGNTVHMIMSDYQCDWDKGATVRYYTFKPTENKICAFTYNTTNSTYETDANSQFCFDYQMVIPTDPSISAVANSPVYPKSDETAVVSARITDNVSIASATLSWGLSADNLTNTLSMASDGDTYTATIPVNADGSTVYYSISATDGDQNTTVSDIFSYLIDDDGSNLPCPYNTSQAPYNGIIEIPGILEAENYNDGCENVAYFDSEAENQGGAYRDDGVDIETCQDSDGGYNLGYLVAGEWLNYQVNVATTGTYTVDFRVASNNNNTHSLHLEVDDTDITGTVNIPSTGGWQSWQTVSLNNVSLTAGEQTMKLVADGGDFNLNHITFTLTSNITEPLITNIALNPASPSSSETVTATANIVDDVAVVSASVLWGTSPGNLVNQISMTADGSTFAGTIPAQPNGTTVYCAISATDGDGNTTTSLEKSYSVSDLSYFHSHEVVMQSGTPQATVSDGTNTASLEFYQSLDNTVAKGSLFATFTSGSHVQSFNHASHIWSSAAYPYAAKSTVARGDDDGETATPEPVGVYDLQMHPPSGNQLTVCNFIAPQDGQYTIKQLGVRRVYSNTAQVALKVYDADETLVTSLTANSRAWVIDNTAYELGVLAKNDIISFAVDKVDDYSYDATEILWTIALSKDTMTGLPKETSPSKEFIRIFPNPTPIGQVFIELPTCAYAFQVKIKDLQGKQLLAIEEAYGESSIKLNGFAKGMYLIEVSTPVETKIQKLIVE